MIRSIQAYLKEMKISFTEYLTTFLGNLHLFDFGFLGGSVMGTLVDKLVVAAIVDGHATLKSILAAIPWGLKVNIPAFEGVVKEHYEDFLEQNHFQQVTEVLSCY